MCITDALHIVKYRKIKQFARYKMVNNHIRIWVSLLNNGRYGVMVKHSTEPEPYIFATHRDYKYAKRDVDRLRSLNIPEGAEDALEE